jgi:hypothetical protein
MMAQGRTRSIVELLDCENAKHDEKRHDDKLYD